MVAWMWEKGFGDGLNVIMYIVYMELLAHYPTCTVCI